MSEQPYMQLWIADYLGDTQHLTAEQSGCYLHLLMCMWRAGGFLPGDDTKLARIARVSVKRWQTIRDDVMAFFDVEGDEITQKRLLIELQKARGKSKSRSDAGKAGAAAKALKNKKRTKANAKANGQAKVQHSPKPVSPNGDTNIGETPLSILQTVLDDEHAQAVVDYRQRRKEPLNLIAARRLAKQFSQWPSPNDAAAEMMLRNWRGFKPEWMQDRPGRGPPRQQPTYADQVAQSVQKIERELDERDGKRDSEITTPSGDRYSYGET